MTTYEEIKSTADFLHERLNQKPQVGIVLGTGLGGLVREIEILQEISYTEIPGFPLSTVEGHAGKLIEGRLGGKNVLCMQGRFHFYEGYSMQQIVFPIRVMKLLGIGGLVVSNASGGVNPDFEIGDLMVIKDHINLFPGNPLIGPNISELGTRFPDMSDAYEEEWRRLAFDIAEEMNIRLVDGVYVGLTGPTLETPHEYFYIRTIGGDAVGMSTVPEVIAARHMKLPVFAISIVTDLGVEGKIEVVTHEDVQSVAEVAEPKMTRIIKELISRI